MPASPKSDPAEHRRRVLLTATALLLLISGGALTTLTHHAGPLRTVDIVQMSGLMLLALVVALRSTTSFRLTPRNPALDDELSRANRASAATTGFWCMMAAGMLAVAGGVMGAATLAEAAPLLIVFGAVGSGVRFAILEGRGGARE